MKLPITDGQICYKIRNKDTGLFSTGGYYNSWSTKGKAWASVGALKGHLAMFTERSQPTAFAERTKNWEVLTFVLAETAAVSVADLYPPKEPTNV